MPTRHSYQLHVIDQQWRNFIAKQILEIVCDIHTPDISQNVMSHTVQLALLAVVLYLVVWTEFTFLKLTE